MQDAINNFSYVGIHIPFLIGVTCMTTETQKRGNFSFVLGNIGISVSGHESGNEKDPTCEIF